MFYWSHSILPSLNPFLWTWCIWYHFLTSISCLTLIFLNKHIQTNMNIFIHTSPKENWRGFQKFHMVCFGVLNSCTKISRNFRTNYSVGSSLRQKKELSRSSRVNKALRYFGLLSTALDGKQKQQNWKKKTYHCNASPTQSLCCVYKTRNKELAEQTFFIVQVKL